MRSATIASTPNAGCMPGAACRRCATARTRTSRPRIFCRRRCRQRHAGRRPQAAGQGTVVQQHRRRRCSAGMRASQFDAPACVIVKHANPCGVAVADSIFDRLRASFRDRSDVGIRRHHRIQPAARRRHGSGDRRASVRRGHRRAVDRRRCGRGLCREKERPPARDRLTAGRRHDGLRFQESLGRAAGAGTADRGVITAADLKVVSERQPSEAEKSRPAVRLDGRQVRQVQCHRLLQATGARSVSAPAR